MRHTVYEVLVVAHVLAAVVGFGMVAISGVYGALAGRIREGSAGGVEELNRYFQHSGRGELLLLAVPFLGGAALLVEGKGHFGDAWVLGALLIWAAAATLLVGVIRPAEAELRRRVTDRLRATDLDVSVPGRRLSRAAAACDAGFAVALVLMVVRPT